MWGAPPLRWGQQHEERGKRKGLRWAGFFFLRLGRLWGHAWAAASHCFRRVDATIPLHLIAGSSSPPVRARSMGARRRRNSRREQASAPEAALLEREASEGEEILRRNKEMMEAMAEEWGTKSTAEEAGAGKKKRKKVVKTRLPQALIDQYRARGYAEDETEVTDDESEEN